MLRSLVFLYLTSASCVYSARIVGVFPFHSKSHWILGSALLMELADRGHEVTMISPFPLDKPYKNYKDVDLVQVREYVISNADALLKNFSGDTTSISKIYMIMNTFKLLTNKVILDKSLHEYLDSQPETDLVINLNNLCDSLLVIGYKLKAPTILFNSVPSNYMLDYYIQTSTPYSYVPHILTDYSDSMNFWQRLWNTLISIRTQLIYHYVHIPEHNEMIQKYFPGTPHISELIENVDLALVNSNIAMESASPYLPNMIRIGGYQMFSNEELPVNLQTYLNSSKYGVIYFSLGSNVQSSELLPEVRKVIVDAFSESKYDILWKFEDELPNKPKNIRTEKWLPQKLVLAHPKVIAFITHAGFGGITEGTFNCVPMICIPLFGDQKKNCADIVKNGHGVRVDIESLNKESFLKALNEITSNSKYSDAVKLHSSLLKDQEINPMDRAVYWIEYVIKHKGAKHLKARASSLPWYQYHLLDVICFILAIISLICFVIIFSVKKTIKLFNRKKVKLN